MTGGRFRDDQPLAWTFHKNTSRWAHNAMAPAKDVLPAPAKEYPRARLFPLPAAAPRTADFADLVGARLSCRSFSDAPVSLLDLAALLKLGYGAMGRAIFGRIEILERPVPSGGGLYPLEIYLIARRVDGLPAGILHYAVVPHALELVREVEVPKRLLDYLFMGQTQLAAAPVLLVITAVTERSLGKYGDRGYRYLLLEAGHVAQNVNLAAAALALGTCNIGGFFDVELGTLLALDGEREVPLYAIAVGHPAGTTRDAMRAMTDQAAAKG